MLTYVEQKALLALEQADDDGVEAARLLSSWAAEDPILLLEMVTPYLNGASTYTVQKAMRLRRKFQQPGAKRAPKKPLSRPASNDPLDMLLGQLVSDKDHDAAGQSKALRVMAKAYIAQKLDAKDALKKAGA